MRFFILREEATHVTVTLGTVYLCYSAFFVTIELTQLNNIVRYIICGVYFGLTYLMLSNISRNFKVLREHITHTESVEIPELIETLKLKKYMMR